MSDGNSSPTTPVARSDANLAHTSSASPEASQAPPFPISGTAEGEQQRSPPPKYPNAENLINATAKHIIPEVPAPSADEEEDKAQISKPDSDEDQREAREEEPLLKGTPLDELITPGFARAPASFTASKSVTEEDPATPPQEDVSPTHVDTDRPSLPQQQQRPASRQEARQQPGRPGFGAMRGVGSDSVRMGTSALVSALNALPWDEDEDADSSDSDDEPKGGRGRAQQKPSRPKPTRMQSSLHTIRPMATPIEEDIVEVPPADQVKPPPVTPSSLAFPFRANTIARRARSPGQTELQYQFAQMSMTDKQQAERRASQDYFDNDELASRRSSAETVSTDGGLPANSPARRMMQDRISREEHLGQEEEAEELEKAGASPETDTALGPIVESSQESPAEANAPAALREGSSDEELIEERMLDNPAEKKRVRREQLAERLQEVFGLAEKEDVLDEMRCWLLRSVMLKGYMYLTAKHICFFAHMPTRENAVVRTGPLYKKASRTKMNNKYWVVLRNDVLSWFESTADPYFPKGNISLQYVSSCDAVDETRFKLRTPERNYTFKADTEDGRDEWVKSIQKVMFKTQHEGESVKLIIPLEAVLDVERTPTLEFAETLEVRCVDSEDQMSVDSYFFASFQDGEKALKTIRARLDARPSSDLPTMDSTSTLPTDGSAPQKQRSTQTTVSHAAGSGLKKIGSILKPILPGVGSSDKDREVQQHQEKASSSASIPFASKTGNSHDSLETLTPDRNAATTEVADATDDGYPPRQTGTAPSGMGEDGKGWGPDWIRKPVSKILSTSPTSTLSLGRKPSNQSQTAQSGRPSEHTRQASDHLAEQLHLSPSPSGTRGRAHEGVTEVVEPTVADGPPSDSDDATQVGRHSSKTSRFSVHSSTSVLSGQDQEYSIMDQSESGRREYEETAKKFRSVFSLSESEELIDHFPGFLYRVLPVSGRFFVSTNYFCFRSSQLLYKTKMIIPIRDLYGLKAQKAFRFGHSGLIVVIKGHEEVFLEFSSSKRRKACITLLESLMEEVRVRSEKGEVDLDDVDQDRIQARIMEDLDDSTSVDARGGGDKQYGPAEPGMSRVPQVSPSPLFGSTTSTFLEFKPEPMRITCLTIGSRGDVQPYIALCKGLQAEGHTTRIATHGEYKDWVEGHGIEFASVGGDPAELMQMCVDNGMFTVSFLKEGINKFRGWLDELLSSSWEACQNSDLLIESPSAMGGVHIAEALRIPYYRAFTMPWTRTRAYPHAFAVPEHKKGGSYNYMTYTMFDQVFWRAISGQVNRFRKKVLNIESTNFDKLEQHKIPFLYNFSPSVVHPPLDWTEWIHVTGYWFLENADESAKKSKWTPPDGLLEFIDKAHERGKKVVYIGFGSIVVSDPEEMTRCVVDAVVNSDVYAILSKGWSDRGSKAKGDTGDEDGADGIEYPESIYAIDSIDHSWLFPRIDAACHHGGAGTTGASLRAGIPTIIKPFFGDQAFWSERVESLGIGSAIRKLTAEHLTEALVQATTDEKQVTKAKVVGEMIRKENGVAKAIEAIYRDLEYAKSLVKPAPQHHASDSNEEGGPLDKVTSLLHPLTSNESSPFRRSRHRSKGQEERDQEKVDMHLKDKDKDKSEGSEESWDVVSEGRALSSPERA